MAPWAPSGAVPDPGVRDVRASRPCGPPVRSRAGRTAASRHRRGGRRGRRVDAGSRDGARPVHEPAARRGRNGRRAAPGPRRGTPARPSTRAADGPRGPASVPRAARRADTVGQVLGVGVRYDRGSDLLGSWASMSSHTACRHRLSCLGRGGVLVLPAALGPGVLGLADLPGGAGASASGRPGSTLTSVHRQVRAAGTTRPGSEPFDCRPCHRPHRLGLTGVAQHPSDPPGRRRRRSGPPRPHGSGSGEISSSTTMRARLRVARSLRSTRSRAIVRASRPAPGQLGYRLAVVATATTGRPWLPRPGRRHAASSSCRTQPGKGRPAALRRRRPASDAATWSSPAPARLPAPPPGQSLWRAGHLEQRGRQAGPGRGFQARWAAVEPLRRPASALLGIRVEPHHQVR